MARLESWCMVCPMSAWLVVIDSVISSTLRHGSRPSYSARTSSVKQVRNSSQSLRSMPVA